MKYRTLGKNGFRVSEIGLGCWQLGGDWGNAPEEDKALSILRAALDSGVTLFDTADVYGGGRSHPSRFRPSHPLMGNLVPPVGKHGVRCGKNDRGLSPGLRVLHLRSLAVLFLESLVRLVVSVFGTLQSRYPSHLFPVVGLRCQVTASRLLGRVSVSCRAHRRCRAHR